MLLGWSVFYLWTIWSCWMEEMEDPTSDESGEGERTKVLVSECKVQLFWNTVFLRKIRAAMKILMSADFFVNFIYSIVKKSGFWDYKSFSVVLHCLAVVYCTIPALCFTCMK